MSEVDRAMCREAAAECVELARATADLEIKEKLLARAQEWLKLAYSDHDTIFNELVSGFNTEQMFRPGPVQRQPIQQQQKKAEDEK